MITNQSTLFLIIYVAVWISPMIVAYCRQHPKRLAITLTTLIAGWFCPVTLTCLVWSFWPKPPPTDLPELAPIRLPPTGDRSPETAYELYSDE